MKLENNRLIAALLSFSCPVIAFWFPWYWRKSDTALLRKVKSRATWRVSSGIKAKTVILLKVILWPFVALIALILCWMIHSKKTRRMSGRGRLKQLLELLYFTFWRGFKPQDYYFKRFYRFKITEVVNDFLSGSEEKILNLTINKYKDLHAIIDKARFAERCREKKLPAIPIERVYEKGNEQRVENISNLPRETLFFKPTEGGEGIGIERWEYNTETKDWEFEGRLLSEEALCLHFKKTSVKETHILQRAARNHAALAPFSESGLITFRVITVLGLAKEPEVIIAYMLLPRGNAFTSNFYGGGIIAKMDLETHCFDFGMSQIPYYDIHSHHPDTGKKIKGHQLREWPQLEALAKRAHLSFPEAFSVGWDLTLTPDGPIIVEGNTQWGSTPEFFIGKTSYVERYLEILKKEKEAGGWLGDLL